jgi:hypothetical protein
MKRLFFLLMLVSMGMLSCTKEEPVEEVVDPLQPTSTQNGFAINYTATWCGYCGSWGAPLIHDLGTAAPKGAVMTIHASNDPMFLSGLYSSFTQDRTTGGGIPSFWVGDIKTSSNNSTSTMTSLLGSGPAKAGVDYTYSISGTTMTIKTKVKFFNPGEGMFYLNVYALEDGINGNSTAGAYKQSGTSQSYPNDDYKHDFVLRAAAVSENAYGELIATNPTDAKEVSKTYTITLQSSWKNPYPVVVVYKYDAAASVPQYKFINSLKKK